LTLTNYKKGFFLLLCTFTLLLPASSDIVDDSKALFDHGDRDAALILLDNWLTENPDNPDYERVYITYLSFQPSANDIFKELGDEVNYFSALTAEMMGNYTLARNQFLELASQTNDLQTEIRYNLDAAEMSLKLGYLTTAKSEVNLLLPLAQGDSLSRAILLSTRILLMEGRGPRAIKIIEKSMNADSSIDGSFFLANLNNQLQIQMDSYPKSPESLIVYNKIYRVYDPVSLGLIDNAFNIDYVSTPAVQEEVPPVISFIGKIQAGSFLVKDNADELEKVLSDLGWEVSIDESIRNNKVYYKVLIINLNPESLNDELQKLKSRGFDGFILQ